MSATLTISCAKCENSGIINRQNGPDDFDQEYCTCFYGQQKEMFEADEVADAWEGFAVFDAQNTIERIQTLRNKEAQENDYSNSERESYGF